MSAKPLATLLTEITTNFPDNTSGAITPAIARTTYSDMSSSAIDGTFINVMQYAGGATINDGTTACDAAFTAAFSALASTNGTLFIPAGTYNFKTTTMTPPSNCLVQGAGIDATTILNTSTGGGTDSALTVVMTMSGGSNAGLWPANNTTYPINTPTLGATTVTTTTAANAGNFVAGNIIMVSGGLGGGNSGSPPTDFWFPAWYTTVVSANAGTGVITLAETLPLSGNNFTLVQIITSLPKNITVRDLTLKVNSNISGTSGAIMEILGVDTFLIENVKFVNANPLLPGAGIALGAPARRSGFRNCHAGQGAGPIELFGASSSFIEGCTTDESSFLIDGGCFDCTVINNMCKDPQENAASFNGIHIPSWTSRIRVIGNSITGIPSSWTGINTVDTPDASRFHTIIGNHLTGANTTSTTGVTMCKGVCVGNMFQNLQNGIVLESGNDAIIEGNYYDTTTTTPLSTFAGTGVYRTRQNPTLKAMAGGSATPTVTGGETYTLTQGGAQNVTGFVGGVPGDRIAVVTQDAQTTFKQGANLQMKSGSDYNAPNNTVMCFLCLTTTLWIEESRTQ